MSRRPTFGERRYVHDIQRLQSYGDPESVARADGLERALNQIGRAFGKAPLDTSEGATAWPEGCGL